VVVVAVCSVTIAVVAVAVIIVIMHAATMPAAVKCKFAANPLRPAALRLRAAVVKRSASHAVVAATSVAALLTTQVARTVAPVWIKARSLWKVLRLRNLANRILVNRTPASRSKASNLLKVNRSLKLSLSRRNLLLRHRLLLKLLQLQRHRLPNWPAAWLDPNRNVAADEFGLG
jgi:hypothetical protein